MQKIVIKIVLKIREKIVQKLWKKCEKNFLSENKIAITNFFYNNGRTQKRPACGVKYYLKMSYDGVLIQNSEGKKVYNSNWDKSITHWAPIFNLGMILFVLYFCDSYYFFLDTD